MLFVFPNNPRFGGSFGELRPSSGENIYLIWGSIASVFASLCGRNNGLSARVSVLSSKIHASEHQVFSNRRRQRVVFGCSLK